MNGTKMGEIAAGIILLPVTLTVTIAKKIAERRTAKRAVAEMLEYDGEHYRAMLTGLLGEEGGEDRVHY